MYCRAVGNMLKIDIKVRASENILVKTGTNCNIVFCVLKNVMYQRVKKVYIM